MTPLTPSRFHSTSKQVFLPVIVDNLHVSTGGLISVPATLQTSHGAQCGSVTFSDRRHNRIRRGVRRYAAELNCDPTPQTHRNHTGAATTCHHSSNHAPLRPCAALPARGRSQTRNTHWVLHLKKGEIRMSDGMNKQNLLISKSLFLKCVYF